MKKENKKLQLKLKCLELATKVTVPNSEAGNKIVEIAKRFFEFVMDTKN